MKKISSIDCLNSFRKIVGMEWKNQMDQLIQNDKVDIDNDILDSFEKFIDTFRNAIINEEQQEIKEVEQLIDNEILYVKLNKYMDNLLKTYKAAIGIRKIEQKDIEIAKKAIETILNEYIIRFNPDLEENFEKLGFEENSEYLKFIGVFDALVTFAITKHLCKKSMEELIIENLYVSNSLGKYIATCINKHYQELQLKLIIDGLYNTDKN